MDEKTVFYFDVIEDADGKEDADEYDILEEQIRIFKTMISKKIFEKGQLVEERIYDGNNHVQTINYYSNGMIIRRECYDTDGDDINCTSTLDFIRGRMQKKDCISMTQGGDDDQQDF